MTLDQLELLVETAARSLVERHDRPLPVGLVVPLAGSTQVTELSGFPAEDAERTDALSVFAARHMVPHNAPCFGFVAEADGPGGEDLLLVVYGARRRGSFVTAAELLPDGTLTAFTDPEPLDADALPFIQPLQHAADLAAAEDDPSAGGGLPIISS